MNSFDTRTTLTVGDREYTYYSLPKFAEQGFDVNRLPYSLKILLENLLRNEDGVSVSRGDIEALAQWDPSSELNEEILFKPARVLLQDFTGVPAVVDLAAMRDAIVEMGGDATKINPLLPSELVIDHSVQVDAYGSPTAMLTNAEKEFERNQERYQFLRWGQTAFDNFSAVPPDTGIVHQVNLEYLGRCVFDHDGVAYPDSCVGTDSHTPMINGLGVLGWGVGGIEAEAAMLGQSIPMLIPQVIGFRLTGKLPEGATATDLVLTVARVLRDKGVVGKFVEFFGDGVGNLSLNDRAVIGNMTPEYGATVTIFPIDQETLNFLRFTGRSEERVALVEAYARAQGLFRVDGGPVAEYTDIVELDLESVVPCMAGPKLPHRKIPLTESKSTWEADLGEYFGGGTGGGTATAVQVTTKLTTPDGREHEVTLQDGSVVIAAITSCTNTSNPHVMVAAGLVAKKAVERGLTQKPWVKTSLAPGSLVVTEYLQDSGLLAYLEKLGFHVVGYGCTTCIGNSGPLPAPISQAVREHDLVACSVLSGNRNFEGRINPDSRANYLASPPLVVAYAIAGRMDFDPYSEPIGQDPDGNDVFLKDIWPTTEEIRETVRTSVKSEMYKEKYSTCMDGDERWQTLEFPAGDRWAWPENSTYVRRPSFLMDIPVEPNLPGDISGARVLALLGDAVTTDHISPAGSIAKDSPAAKYLEANGVEAKDFNSYGSRRGNHEVMMRGTFANIRLRNRLAPGTEGGITRHMPSGEQMTIFDAAQKYAGERTPLVVLAGDLYGTGSSRDWAAKGTLMLGVKAVIAKSYERIHRSNLIGMGVLPLEFAEGAGYESLGLTGEETYSLSGIGSLEPRGTVAVIATAADGTETTFQAMARIDTPVELDYYRNGGILPFVLRQLL
jgi:aconitate hydratase